jgi:hypothetical protein
MQPKTPDRLQEKLDVFPGAFLVPPVPDPHHISVFLHVIVWYEDIRIGGLVPGPDTPVPSVLEINALNRFSIRQHTVVIFQFKGADFLRVRIGSMMGVMKEELVAAAPEPVSSQPANERRFIPLVDNDEIHVFQNGIKVEFFTLVWKAAETMVVAAEFGKWSGPVIPFQILETPTVCRFIDKRFVPEVQQLGHNPSQEMSVAVVPVRHQ